MTSVDVRSATLFDADFSLDHVPKRAAPSFEAPGFIRDAIEQALGYWRRGLSKLDRAAEAWPHAVPRVIIPKVFADALDEWAEAQTATAAPAPVVAPIVEVPPLGLQGAWNLAAGAINKAERVVGDVASNQGSADLKISAAEYEFDRLLADLTPHMALPVRRRTARVYNLPKRARVDVMPPQAGGSVNRQRAHVA